jgi:hypothetical protein
MDRLDAEILEVEIGSQQGIVAKRISEIIDTLDCAYGTNRKSGDMGGFVLYFPTEEVYETYINKIFDFYHIVPDRYEYKDRVGEDTEQTGKSFQEVLYMVGSDDAIVLVHPVKQDSEI